MVRKALPVLGETPSGLGLSTIMDGALAAEFGVDYVRLAAVAIDIDRVRVVVEDGQDLDESAFPFAWEVFLTEAALLRIVDGANERHQELLDLLITSIFDTSAEGPALGSQLLFAIYDAVRRGALPASLGKGFGAWKRKPENVVTDLSPLWQDPASHLATLAKACLAIELDPPLSPPARELLSAFVR